MKRRSYDYSAYMIPTQEEVLEVNFWSIVSDCRGIYNGTLTPRPWADLADTWIDEPRETKLYRLRKARQGTLRAKVVEKLPSLPPTEPVVVAAPRMKRQKKDYGLPVPRHFRKMVNILVKNGLNVWDARMKARELLGLK